MLHQRYFKVNSRKCGDQNSVTCYQEKRNVLNGNLAALEIFTGCFLRFPSQSSGSGGSQGGQGGSGADNSNLYDDDDDDLYT